jgi:hypothetical protein
MRVLFARYAGRVFKGLDGRHYRVMSQECIAAGLPGSELEIAEPQGEAVIYEGDPVASPVYGMNAEEEIASQRDLVGAV